VSRWAIGVVVIATIAGVTQGVKAWLLGSSFAIGLGVIAGLLDMIPNIGATIAGSSSCRPCGRRRGSPLAATIQIFVQELTKARRGRVAAAKASAG
jgi:hypothetical protein